MVYQALPEQIGYTLRTHHLARAQRQIGLEPSVVVRPTDRLFPRQRVFADGTAVVSLDGIPYYRLSEPDRWKRYWNLTTQYLLDREVRGAYRFGRNYCLPSGDGWEPFLRALASRLSDGDVIHAHTPHLSARHGLELARRLGKPFVYEVRGFWEMTLETYGSGHVHGMTLDQWVAEDTELARQADAVITLGEAMRSELIRRGVDPDKVHVVGNGVDVDRFETPRGKDTSLLQRLELQDRFILGYVTSVRALEGIDTLLGALQILLQRNVPASVVLVGDGDDLPRLRQLASTLNISQHVRFVGRAPHGEVNSYYSLFDVFVVPRTDARVCRIVTPLKPLEAMAMGIPTVVSDLPALTELVAPGRRGMAFEPDTPENLADVVQELWQNRDRAAELGREGRRWVQAERNWIQLAQQGADVYRRVLNTALPTAVAAVPTGDGQLH